jgi:hypothetical protein
MDSNRWKGIVVIVENPGTYSQKDDDRPVLIITGLFDRRWG